MPESSASLGLVVDSSGALTAVESLRKLAQTGAQTEQATERLTSATQKQTVAQRQSSDMFAVARRETEATRQRIQAMKEGIERNNAALARHTAATQQTATAHKSAGVGVNAFREPLTMLATQMTGMSPIAGRLTSLIGSFAMGSAWMVAVLAGVAALSGGYNKLTEDSRRLREEEEKRAAGLRSLVEAQQGAALGKAGSARQQLDQLNIDNAPMLARVAGAHARLANGITGAQSTLDEELPALQAYTAAANALKRVIAEGNKEQQASLDTLARRAALQRELNGVSGQGELAAKMVNLRHQEEAELAALLLGGDAKLVAQKRELIAAYYAQARAAAVAAAAADRKPVSFELGDMAPLYQLNPLGTRAVPGSTGGADLNATMAGVDAITRRQDAVAKAAATQGRFNQILEQQNRSLAVARQRIEDETQAAIAAAAAQKALAEARAQNNRQIAIQAGLQIGGMVSSHLTSSGHRTAGAAVGIATSTAAGFASGGPVGAAAGLVVGLTSAFLDHNRAAREAKEAEKALTEQRKRAAEENFKNSTYAARDAETRSAFARAEIARNEGRTKEAAKLEREARELEMKRRHERELYDAVTAGLSATALAAIITAQALEQQALATQKVADEARRLTGDLNGPQGLRRSLYLWRTGGDQSTWGANGNPGNGPFSPRGGGGVGTETVTTNVNISGPVTVEVVSGGSGETDVQLAHKVAAGLRKIGLNGGVNPVALALRR